MRTEHREKTWLLATLGALLLAITAIVVWWTHRLLVPPWVIASIAVPWIGLGVVLRLNTETIGFEGKVVDWWSIPHFIGGVLFGLVGLALGYAIAIAAAWEIVEVYAHTREHPTNRVADVVLAVAGWALANALAGGDFSWI